MVEAGSDHQEGKVAQGDLARVQEIRPDMVVEVPTLHQDIRPDVVEEVSASQARDTGSLPEGRCHKNWGSRRREEEVFLGEGFF